MMWMMAKRPCKKHSPPPQQRRESLLEAAFNDAMVAFPSCLPNAQDSVPLPPPSPSPPPPPALKKKRKYRLRSGSEEILDQYSSIRQRVNSGDSLMSTLRHLNIPYTTFVRTFKPMGEVEALEPGFISYLNLPKTTLSPLAKLCKDRLKLVTNVKREDAKKDGSTV